MAKRSDFEQRIERIDTLVERLEAATDPAMRATAKELVQSLMDLHGAGLERMLTLVHERGDAGSDLIDQFGRDDLVRSLLLLYGLHPDPIETRVLEGLDKARPYLKSHGGNVELVGVDDDGIVRLRLQGTCHSCPSSSMTMKLAVEQSIREAAPEVSGVVVVEEADNGAHRQISLPVVQIQTPRRAAGNGAAPYEAAWEDVDGLTGLAADTMVARALGGHDVVFCRVGDGVYAYADRCPGCGSALSDATLSAHTLTCSACAASYDVVEAGRGIGRVDLHLEPFPLLFERGRAKVALPFASAAAAVS